MKGLTGILALTSLISFLPASFPQADAEPLGGDFTLQSAEGAVSLADLRGRLVPIYFGYMSCPDLCPMTMSVLGSALGALDDSESRRVQALFISLDPPRDDLQRLSEYARRFSSTNRGCHGIAG